MALMLWSIEMPKAQTEEIVQHRTSAKFLQCCACVTADAAVGEPASRLLLLVTVQLLSHKSRSRGIERHSRVHSLRSSRSHVLCCINIHEPWLASAGATGSLAPRRGTRQSSFVLSLFPSAENTTNGLLRRTHASSPVS